MYFLWKVKWRLEHLGALGTMGETAPSNIKIAKSWTLFSNNVDTIIRKYLLRAFIWVVTPLGFVGQFKFTFGSERVKSPGRCCKRITRLCPIVDIIFAQSCIDVVNYIAFDDFSSIVCLCECSKIMIIPASLTTCRICMPSWRRART